MQRRRRWPLVTLVVAVVAILTVAVVVLGLAHHERVEAERRDPSFRFGQKVMVDEIYASLRGNSVQRACRSAMQAPPSPPPDLNRSRAVDGCVYEEQLLDN